MSSLVISQGRRAYPCAERTRAVAHSASVDPAHRLKRDHKRRRKQTAQGSRREEPTKAGQTLTSRTSYFPHSATGRARAEWPVFSPAAATSGSGRPLPTWGAPHLVREPIASQGSAPAVE